jgi:RNA polymerase sigma factor (sigma-70 family)
MAEAADQPHRDPSKFDECVEAIGPDSCLVVIENWMGAAVRSWCSPEDLWQETLVQAWRDRERHTWTGPRAWRTWVLSIAKNRVMDAARTAGAAKRGGDARAVAMADLRGPDGGSVTDLFPAGSVTPSRIASHRERAEILKRALEGLDPKYREIVRLHLFEERPMEEVAAELGLENAKAWYRFRKGVEKFTDAVDALRSSTRGGSAA